MISDHGFSPENRTIAIRASSSSSYPFGAGLRRISRNRACVALNFPDRFRNLVHIFLVTEQGKLRNPDCFPSRTLCVWEFLLQEVMLLCRLYSGQTLPVLAAPKTIQFMKWRITRLCRNSFGVQCRDEILGRDSGKFFGIDVENVRILAIARATRVAFLRCDPRNVGQQLVEEATVAVPIRRLF